MTLGVRPSWSGLNGGFRESGTKRRGFLEGGFGSLGRDAVSAKCTAGPNTPPDTFCFWAGSAFPLLKKFISKEGRKAHKHKLMLWRGSG